jgi:hypothetical protein
MSERDTAGGPPHGESTEFRFKIDAYTPTTIPMLRLGEYMTQLALVLGESASVHFLRVDEGSTEVVHWVDHEAIPKVRMRAEAVRRGDGPHEAVRAFRTINKMLREDNGAGILTHGKSVRVLDFPGRDQMVEVYPAVRQQGTLDGQLVRVGGLDLHKAKVILLSEGEQIVGCNADHGVAKKLGGHLYEHVRLFGTGRWRRDGDGTWSLLDFKVSDFKVLPNVSLSVAVAELREISGDIEPGAYDELEVIRHGPARRGNGGH